MKKDISLQELYVLLEKMEKSDYKNSEIKAIKLLIEKKELILEDSIGVALAGASTAGMGNVVSSQPSAFPGALNGTAWASGGSDGSGDIGVPYNPSGSNRMFQKIPAGGLKRKQSDPHQMVKKSRTKKLDMKSIRDVMKSKKSSGKIMNFDSFSKKDINTKVTKVKEGKAYDVAKKVRINSHDISRFQEMIENHVRSLNAKVKKIGSDLEIHFGGKHVAQVMFREDYIAVKKEGSKFPEEFKYTELGKIKSELNKIIK